MIEAPQLDPNRRHDFLLLFDVTDGNPNGDPDAGNLPRVDPETMHGLVTDVAIKRKVRDWVHAAKGDEERYKIYVQSNEALNTLHERAYTAINERVKKPTEAADPRATDWMCANFYDIRTFGAVMTTGANAGQVRGPVQFTFARSIDPIVPLDVTITRIAVTKTEDLAKASDPEGEGGGKRSEMGRKAIVPYGLYRAHGFINPHYAEKTGFNTDDLALLWKALGNMWDLDRSSARGFMTCRGLHVFTHTSALGDAPAHTLLERIKIKKRDDSGAPRRFGNYDITVESADLPAEIRHVDLAA